MLFAYEVARHGARAPLKQYEVDFGTDFNRVQTQQLSQQGMRQRYLLGKYNRMRYIEQYQLLSPNYVPGEYKAVSTDVNRTIQSAYSEITGMYSPTSS